MNSLIFPVLVTAAALFHLVMRSYMRRGNVKTAFCTIWCMDVIFSICGTVLSFVLYDYLIFPYLTVRNVVMALIYLLITIMIILIAPSGPALFQRKKGLTEEEILLAEYRLNDTFGIIRNCLMCLLFALPILFALLQRSVWFSGAFAWNEAEICGGFCFMAYLILVPICLRQALFWFRNLSDTSTEAEETALRKYQMQMRFRHRNFGL